MKRILAIMLVLVMITALGGCASTGAPDPAVSSSRPEKTTSVDQSASTPEGSDVQTESEDAEDYLSDIETTSPRTDKSSGGGDNSKTTSTTPTSGASSSIADTTSAGEGISAVTGTSSVPSGGNLSVSSSGASDTSSSVSIDLPIHFF